jgi:hypothetical protein
MVAGCYYDFRVGAKQNVTDPASFTTATILLALRDAMTSVSRFPTNLTAPGDTVPSTGKRKNDNSYAYMSR